MKPLPGARVKAWSLSWIITEVNGSWGLSLLQGLSIAGVIVWHPCFKWWKKVQLEDIGHMMHMMENMYLVPIFLHVCHVPCHAIQPCLGLTEIRTANHGLKMLTGRPHTPLNVFYWVPSARVQVATISISHN